MAAKRTCAVDFCQKPAKCRGWCNAHYEQWRKRGDPLYRAPKRTVAERVWPKVDRSAGPDACWPWLGCYDEKGYGMTTVDGKTGQRICRTCQKDAMDRFLARRKAERTAPHLKAGAVVGAIMPQYSQIKDGFAFILQPPPILGLGNSKGFKLYLQERANIGLPKLFETAMGVIGAASQAKTPDGRPIFDGFAEWSLVNW